MAYGVMRGSGAGSPGESCTRVGNNMSMPYPILGLTAQYQSLTAPLPGYEMPIEGIRLLHRM